MHIDNGGLSMEAKAFYHDGGEFATAELKIENCFYGYATNSITLHVGENGSSLSAKDLRAMADFFNKIAAKLPE